VRTFITLVLVGCSSSDGEDDDGSTTPGPEDTDTTPLDTDTTGGDTDTDTTPPTGATLDVSCAATPNALRFLCTVTVDPPQPVELTFVRTDGLSAARTVEGPDVAGTHELGLYFMAPGQDYDVIVVPTAFPEVVATTTVTTGTVPPAVASSLDVTGTSTMEFIGTHDPCDSDAIGVVYDASTGQMVWYQLFEPGGTFGANDMLIFTDDHTVLGESVGSIIEVDLMGNDVVRLPDLATDFGIPVGGLFGNFHHDIHKRNGIYYVIAQEDFGGNDVLDQLILFDATGAELGRWHARDHLDLPANWSGDFLHTNAVYADTNGDIIVSMLSQTLIAKLDGDLASPTFGDPYWLLDGRPGAGDLAGTLTTDFGAVGPPGYFDNQHSVFVRDDGRLELLDDGAGRALVISIDEVASTATVDAEYETAENTCTVQGTARETVAGNPVVACLGDTVREYDVTTGQLVWSATVQCGGGGGGSSRFYPLSGW
jgi:hypothetical protein